MERAVLHNAVRRLNSGLLDEAGLTALLLALCKRGTAGYYLRTRQRTDARGGHLAATDSDDDGAAGDGDVLSLTPLGLSLTLALEPACLAILTHSRVAVAACGVASGDAVAAARAAGFAAATVALLERRAAEARAAEAFLEGLPRSPQHAEWRAKVDAVLAGGCGVDVTRPAEVSPGLFLAAADMLETADPPPTAVVNLCPRMAGRAGGAAAGATAYLEIDCDDAPGYPIVSHADEVCSFVKEQLAAAGETEEGAEEEEGGMVRRRRPAAVYVHCYGGINRSGALCVAYLVKEGGLSLTDAVEACHRRRPIILSNAAFRDQLVSYAFLHGKLV